MKKPTKITKSVMECLAKAIDRLMKYKEEVTDEVHEWQLREEEQEKDRTIQMEERYLNSYSDRHD